MTKAELEEERRKFREMCAVPIPDAPEEVQAVVIPVDPQTAENVRVRPESLRIATRDESGRHRVVGPHRVAVDSASCAVGWIGWGASNAFGSHGLWLTPERNWVCHQYNPLDALKTKD